MKSRRSGVLVVDKPEGPTSHDVVQIVRRRLENKAGHTGTLDPLANGVLPILLGQATRVMRFYQGDDKEYRAQIRLGRSTSTYDREGEPLWEAPVPPLSESDCLTQLAAFQGEIEQIPPPFSAIKVKGERLYKAARRGETVEPPPRHVSIYSLELLAWEPTLWTLKVHCSSGTYIRSLAHDLGKTIGCGAHLENLRRLRSGDFDLSRAVQLDDSPNIWKEKMYTMEELLPQLPRVDLEETTARFFRNGNPAAAAQVESGTARVFHEEKLIGLGEAGGGRIQPKLVFS